LTDPHDGIDTNCWCTDQLVTAVTTCQSVHQQRVLTLLAHGMRVCQSRAKPCAGPEGLGCWQLLCCGDLNLDCCHCQEFNVPLPRATPPPKTHTGCPAVQDVHDCIDTRQLLCRRDDCGHGQLGQVLAREQEAQTSRVGSTGGHSTAQLLHLQYRKAGSTTRAASCQGYIPIVNQYMVLQIIKNNFGSTAMMTLCILRNGGR
jgi:hypothetical protein